QSGPMKISARQLAVRRICLIGSTLVVLLTPAAAAENSCERFAWPLARELAWFGVSDKPAFAVGDSLPVIPKAAFTLRLQPAPDAVFVLPPERAPKSEAWFGGVIRLPALDRAGIHQVSLSEEAWVDVIQHERYARSVGSTTRRDCPELRKSIRFELDSSPLTLQISAVAAGAVTLAIAPAE